MVVVWVTPPPVPVIVRVWVPTFTLLPTEILVVEVPEPGAGMVLGRNFAAAMLALNAMDELNPPEMAVVMVDCPELPRVIVSVFGFALMVKSGVPPPAVRSLIRAAPFGLPQPVTRS